MPTLEDYRTPCKTCNGYNPPTCKQCQEYKKKLIEKHPYIIDAVRITRLVKKYWEDMDLFTWEDYEK